MRSRTKAAVLAVLLASALSFPSCDKVGGGEPVKLVCGLCTALVESGLCSMIQAVSVEKCGEGKTLVITNFEEALREGAPIETGCE